MSISFSPTPTPVNYRSLNNISYVVDLSTTPEDLLPKKYVFKGTDVYATDKIIKIDTSTNSIIIDFLELTQPADFGLTTILKTLKIDGTIPQIGDVVLIKDTTDVYSQNLNDVSVFIPPNSPATVDVPFPPNYFQVNGVSFVPDPSLNYSPPFLANFNPLTGNGGISPYNYYVNFPNNFHNANVIDLTPSKLGIYIVTAITSPTVPINTNGNQKLFFKSITLQRTAESVNILPGSEVYTKAGNVNFGKSFVFTSESPNYFYDISSNQNFSTIDSNLPITTYEILGTASPIVTGNTISISTNFNAFRDIFIGGKVFAQYSNTQLTATNSAFTISGISNSTTFNVSPNIPTQAIPTGISKIFNLEDFSSFSNPPFNDSVLTSSLLTSGLYSLTLSAGTVNNFKLGYEVAVFNFTDNKFITGLIKDINYNTNTIAVFLNTPSFTMTSPPYSIGIQPTSSVYIQPGIPVNVQHTVNALLISTPAPANSFFNYQITSSDAVIVNGYIVSGFSRITQNQLEISPDIFASNVPATTTFNLFKPDRTTQFVRLNNDSRRIDGFNVNFFDGYKVGDVVRITDQFKSTTLTISNIIDDNTLEIATNYLGESFYVASLDLANNSLPVNINKGFGFTDDPLNIGNINVTNLSIQNGSLVVSGSKIIGFSGLGNQPLNTPTFIEHIGGRRLETFQLSNWINDAFDLQNNAITPSAQPVPPNDASELQIFSSSGKIRFKGSVNNGPYNLSLVSYLTEIDRLDVGTLLNVPVITNPAGDFILVSDNLQIAGGGSLRTDNIFSTTQPNPIQVFNTFNLRNQGIINSGGLSGVSSISNTGTITLTASTINSLTNMQFTPFTGIISNNFFPLPGSTNMQFSGANLVNIGAISATSISAGTINAGSLAINGIINPGDVVVQSNGGIVYVNSLLSSVQVFGSTGVSLTSFGQISLNPGGSGLTIGTANVPFNFNGANLNNINNASISNLSLSGISPFYSEGTFTPNFAFTLSNNLTGTFNANANNGIVCNFIKTGNMAYVYLPSNIGLISVNSQIPVNTGQVVSISNLRLTNLPSSITPTVNKDIFTYSSPLVNNQPFTTVPFPINTLLVSANSDNTLRIRSLNADGIINSGVSSANVNLFNINISLNLLGSTGGQSSFVYHLN